MKLNPNHPVSMFMDDQWVKIVAYMMVSDGVTEKVIPPAVLMATAASMDGVNVAIHIDDNIGITLRLVTDAEAKRLSEAEGGLPS